MKKINLLLFSFLIMASGTVSAQKFKYGHINGDAVFSQMPQVQKADTVLQVFVKQFEDEIIRMKAEYDGKVKDYQANEATMNEVIKKTKADDINELGKKMQQFQVDAQKAINEKRAELYNPIIKKFNDALKSVATKNAYKFIIDNSKGVLLYYSDTDDVTRLVKKELGIK